MSTVNAKRLVILVALLMWGAAGLAEADPFVYVLGRTSASPRRNVITVIDAATNTKGPKITLGTSNGFVQPQVMAMAPDGARIYVTNDLEESVSVVSTATNTVVDTWPTTLIGAQPRALAVSPDSRRLYIGRRDGELSVIDIASKTRIASIQLGLGSLFGIAASPDGTRVYVMATGSSKVGIVTLSPYSLISVDLDLAVSFLRGDAVSLSADGRFAYLPQYSTLVDACGGNPNCIPLTPPAGAQSARVQVLDTTTNTVVATTTTGSRTAATYHVAASPNGAVVYATNYGGLLIRLSPTTHGLLGMPDIAALATARAVAFLADSTRAYFATNTSVVAINATTHAVAATIAFGAAVEGQPNAIVTTPPEPPGPPSNLRATVTGNRVSLAWDPPATGTVSGYLFEGGVAPGSVLASIPTGSSAPAFVFDAPSGVFFVRVHATGGGTRSAASNEIQIRVNVPEPPSAPTGVRGLANGSDLALSWTNSTSGGSPTSLLLDVSGAVSATLPLPLSESFTFAGVPPGSYTFSVRAANGSGTSTSSSAVTVGFPGTCPGVPQAPANFAVSRQGSTLSVSWDPPGGGPAVTSYVLAVTGAANLALPLSARSISGAVGSGVYQLAVRAVNPCGTGAATALQSVTVP